MIIIKPVTNTVSVTTFNSVYDSKTVYIAATTNAEITVKYTDINKLVFETTPLGGTVDIASNSNTITGTATSFNTDFVIGDFIKVGNTNSQIGRIATIGGATTMTTFTVFVNAVSSNVYYSTNNISGSFIIPENKYLFLVKNTSDTITANTTVYATATGYRG